MENGNDSKRISSREGLDHIYMVTTDGNRHYGRDIWNEADYEGSVVSENGLSVL